MHGRDGRHDADRRPRELRQVRDLAGSVGAQLQHERLVLGREPEERERQAPLVVEAPRGLEHVEARGEHGGDELLGGRLAVGPGHGHDGNREARPVIGGEPAERPRRVLDEHERHAPGRVVVE